MQPQVSDLLREAKADAPPPSFDVDELVAAGKRRQRRRNAGWAIAAAVAVAIAIGVPQILIRHDPLPPPVAPHPAPARFGPWRFDLLFDGYTVDGLQVAPVSVDVTGVRALIAPATKTPAGPWSIGALNIYRPGVDPSDAWAAAEEVSTEPIGGRPAYFVKPKWAGAPRLVWQYADNAVAVVSSEAVGSGTRGTLTDDQMRQVASAFRLGTPRPVRVPFRVSWLPGDYRLASVSVVSERASSAQFVPSRAATDKLKWPMADYIPRGIVLQVYGDGPDAKPGLVTCWTEQNTNNCQVLTDGRVFLHASGDSEADLRRFLSATVVADLGRPETWLTISAAVPPFALDTGG